MINSLEIYSEFLDAPAECTGGIRDDDYAYKSDICDRLLKAIVWNSQSKVK
ncbi:MAG: hypothetical protein KME17_02080 [Cyanosarcina radialis HA8281-LM2]|jgi:hypothetical protein|nr:hypothetical protein [Cyanosarcina radialis HA8281-LM2]